MFISKKLGFTLIELMIVIAIIAFLSMITVPTLFRFLAKAKRAEAYVNLSSMALAQKAYFAENGKYTQDIGGPSGLNWKPEGSFNYTYGFGQGQEGTNYFIGNLKAPASALAQAKVDNKDFLMLAAADIDNDGHYDIISIDKNNNIKIISDDLASS